MALPEICTQMSIPPELEELADTLAVTENPLNDNKIKDGTSIPDGGGMGSLALPNDSMWQTGRTLRVRILNGSAKIRKKIQDYATVWTQYANIKLDFVEWGPAEIRVNVDSSKASWSYIGTKNLAIQSNLPTMNFGWLTDSTAETEFARVIIHEFGHALGCIHEHQSPAANIHWNKERVYNYYRKSLGWDKPGVDRNIFDIYSREMTQFTSFDTKSIMLYAFPTSFTTNGFSTGWNTELSETDKAFIARVYPGKGSKLASTDFKLLHREKPTREASSRKSFPNYFHAPPQVALGLNYLDISNAADIRVEAFADDITTSEANVHITTWHETRLYSAGCILVAASLNDPDFQIGQFSTGDYRCSRCVRNNIITPQRVEFTRAYRSPPEVVVWINKLDMARDKAWRIRASATDIDASGFTMYINTWEDTKLYRATAAWIAYPVDKPGVASGSYNTTDVRPQDQPHAENSNQISFPAGKFQSTPTVLTALNSLEIDSGSDLRLKLSTDSVSPDGMTWNIDTWLDTTLWSAGASYIAFA